MFQRLTACAHSALKAWLKESARHHANALFPNMHGGRLSVDSSARMLSKHVHMASERCPSFASKRVYSHVLRLNAAMELLQAGVDCSVIALWLGHETVENMQTYLHAHLTLKAAALTKLAPYQSEKPVRFRAGDRLLAFHKAL